MPLWCLNRLSVRAITKKAQLQLDDFKNKSVDANGIFLLSPTYPIPSEDLNIQPGTQMNNGLAIIKARNGDNDLLVEILTYSWVVNSGITTVLALEDHLINTNSADLELGRKAFDNLKKYDATDCYAWCENHWGCKYETDMSTIITDQQKEFIVQVITPWGYPLFWLRKVSKDYKELKFTLLWEINDGVNHGRFKIQNGKQKP